MNNDDPGLFDKREVDDSIPKLNRCFLCGSWVLEKHLKPILVPDQTGCVQKLACETCLDKIMGGSAVQNEPQAGKI
jgi:hypothetical protein